jgi:protein-tyrosine phosphatase
MSEVMCVNFRDVGEFVNLLAGERLMPERRLYRGGKIDFVQDPAHIGYPASIINLRQAIDPEFHNAALLYLPTPNNYRVYDTTDRDVRAWLNDVMMAFANPDLAYPVLIHCRSGKDRTGVAVAALLRILGVPDEIIVEEYLLSEGSVSEQRIQVALAGMKDLRGYFNMADVDIIARNLRDAGR